MKRIVLIVMLMVAYYFAIGIVIANAQEPMPTIYTPWGRVPVKEFYIEEWMSFDEECDAGFGIRNLALVLVDCGEGKLCRDPDNVCHCYLPPVHIERENGRLKQVVGAMCLQYVIKYREEAVAVPHGTTISR